MSETNNTATVVTAEQIEAIKADVIKNAHPTANIFPMMGKDELNNLVVSIRQYGFDKTKPIKRLNGKTTDGRNRETATQIVNLEIDAWNAEHKDDQRAHVKAVYADEASENEAEILAHVLMDNFTRRHLTPSQKAAVLFKSGVLSAAYKKRAELGEAGGKVAGEIATLVASQAKVNADYIYKVKAIAKAPKIGKALLDAIANGEKTVMAAYAEIQAAAQEDNKEKGAEGTDPNDPTAIKDGTGAVVVGEWESYFGVRDKYAELAKILRDAKAKIKEIAAHEGGSLLNEGENLKGLNNLVNGVAKTAKTYEPHCVCPHCDGEGKNPGTKKTCSLCGGAAVLNEAQYALYEKHGVTTEETETETKAETETETEPKGKKGKAKAKAEAETEVAAAGEESGDQPV